MQLLPLQSVVSLVHRVVLWAQANFPLCVCLPNVASLYVTLISLRVASLCRANQHHSKIEYIHKVLELCFGNIAPTSIFFSCFIAQVFHSASLYGLLLWGPLHETGI